MGLNRHVTDVFEPWFKYSEPASSILYESVKGEGESKSLNFIFILIIQDSLKNRKIK